MGIRKAPFPERLIFEYSHKDISCFFRISLALSKILTIFDRYAIINLPETPDVFTKWGVGDERFRGVSDRRHSERGFVLREQVARWQEIIRHEHKKDHT